MANEQTRTNTEYWWVHLTLFSTLLSSWVHLLVTSGCLVRGSTRFNRLVAGELSEGKAGESFLPHTQTKLALILALQRTGGLIAATAVFFGGLWCVFFVLFPNVLPQLLDIAIPVAGSDWATRLVDSVA